MGLRLCLGLGLSRTARWKVWWRCVLLLLLLLRPLLWWPRLGMGGSAEAEAHGLDEGGRGGEARVDLDGTELEGEVEFLVEVGAVLVLASAAEEGGVGSGACRGFAPGQADLDFELVFAARKVSKGCACESDCTHT